MREKGPFKGAVINGITVFMTKIQGHRGSAGTHEENSLAAFQEAFEAGADGIELDLQMTKDLEIVIYHDFKFHDKLIRDCEAKEVGCLTLEELCEKLPLWKFQANLELKRDPRHPEWSHDAEMVAKKVMEIIAEYKLQHSVYYSSFDPQILQAVEERGGQTALLLTGEDFESAYPKEIFKLAKNALIISPHYKVLHKEQVKTLQKMGYQVIPWTVNKVEDWEKMIEFGVEGIITDFPRMLRDYLSH